MKKTENIITDDHYELGITHWQPDQINEVVLILPAMGVPQRFYYPFASYLHDENFTVLTMDYRGIGRSCHKPVREIQTDITTWAQKDIAQCLKWLENRYPKKPVKAVCHSLGGQILGLTEEAAHLQRIVTVATTDGYWNQYNFPRNLAIAFVWHIFYPIPTYLLGYFPGEYLGMGENIPSGAALQCAKWGRSSDYIGDYSNYKNIRAPILSYSFTDDYYCPKIGIDRLHKKYTRSNVTRKHVNPSEVGAKKIGHFGFFQKDQCYQLWNNTVEWLKN